MANTGNTTKDPSRNKSGLFSFIKAIVILVIIMVIECGAAAMFLPSMADTMEIGRRIAKASAGDSSGEDPAEDENNLELDLREVNLGRYYVTSYQPESNTTLRIDLELWATVQATDVAEFEALYEQHQHRLSEQVHVTFRRAELSDLTEPGLGLIKRKILDKSNRTLGKSLIHELIFSNFSFIEQ